MLPKLEYLAWAIQWYGHVRYDLATSGIAPVTVESVGPPSEILAGATDARAPQRWIQAVADRFRVDPLEVAPTYGTTHGIWATYAGLLSAGDDIVVETPVYEPLVRVAQGLGVRVVPFERAASNRYAVDPDDVARALTPKTRLVVVSNLHNPTGVACSDATVAALAEVASRVGARVMVDEVYRDLVDFDRAQPSRGATAFHAAPGVIATSSLTKVYGIGWARAGWVIADRETTAKIRAATLHDAGGVSYALASVGVAAMANIGALYAATERLRAQDDAAAAVMGDLLRGRPHLSWHRAPGSIFGFVVDARGRDLRPTVERAVVEEQVIVAPGCFFGAPAGFRIRCGAIDLETLREGLGRLGRVLDLP